MTPDIMTVLAVLILTVFLLAFDLLRIDVIALVCLLALGWTGVLTPSEALSGFASNAVLAMIAVMVMGRGIEKTGVMDRFARAVIGAAGKDKARITGLMSAAVGLASAVVQNIGTVALFLPAVMGVVRSRNLPASGLVMPVGFAAILGGTLTMVGSSPLILINDLLANAALAPYGLFAVTPVGLALLSVGVALFFFFGAPLLPRSRSTDAGPSPQEELIAAWDLPVLIRHYRVPEKSPLAGLTPEGAGIWSRYQLHVVGIAGNGSTHYAPWRHRVFSGRQELALLGSEQDIRRFAADFGLSSSVKAEPFETLGDPQSAGFAEAIIPPRSRLAGQTLRTFGLRRRYAVEPMVLIHRGEILRDDFSDQRIAAGDTLIVHGLWDHMAEMKATGDFLLATPFPADRRDRSKTWIAALCFALAIGLFLAGFPISLAFLSGAVAMVLTGVLGMDDAYQAVDWKVIFFLAGLIPLGVAMQKTGTAGLLADTVMTAVRGGHPLLLLLAIAGLSTLFSLFLSNVAATVILTPLVISMAGIGGMDPRPLVLLVGVSANNSFVLPTHQVNAMLKTAGGYRNADYLRAGGVMTVLFMTTVVTLFYYFYR